MLINAAVVLSQKPASVEAVRLPATIAGAVYPGEAWRPPVTEGCYTMPSPRSTHFGVTLWSPFDYSAWSPRPLREAGLDALNTLIFSGVLAIVLFTHALLAYGVARCFESVRLRIGPLAAGRIICEIAVRSVPWIALAGVLFVASWIFWLHAQNVAINTRYVNAAIVLSPATMLAVAGGAYLLCIAALLRSSELCLQRAWRRHLNADAPKPVPERRCLGCGYDCAAVADRLCPECGRSVPLARTSYAIGWPWLGVLTRAQARWLRRITMVMLLSAPAAVGMFGYLF
ncbi:MAG: hypothetical protein EA378_06780 [Phycisphaerales bacterium]|nr:MAG: hypothetical protein EA378_06780 [Phycisphaerales bacterium]